MLLIHFLSKPTIWVIPWILQAIAYFFVLKKMGLVKKTCVIPFLAERQMSKKLFSRMRSFYRPFIVAVVVALAAWYLDPYEGVGRTFMYVAVVVYGIFLIRLYRRLTKSFSKGWLFFIGMIIFPPLFLFILGVGKAQYQPLQLKPVKDHGRLGNNLRRAGLVVISVAEIAVLVFGVGFLAIRTLPPSVMVAWEHAKMEQHFGDIKPDDKVISREDMMGEDVVSLDSIEPSRELFFPDHSQDKNVVVLTYIVGSNLENQMGLASANIRQMVEATKQGDNLTFVMEAGGSKRWFTSEIDPSSYGRYEIRGGKINKVEALPGDTCMGKEKTLEEFLAWGKENYPADRYMLVMWDHGGGVAMGYGVDDLNKTKDDSCIEASQVIKAIANSGIKFDLVGFDACLMQDLEIAAALEPYTDYYMASEEVEGGFGWYYTDAFGSLAKEPGRPTQDFGRDLLSEYDQLNTIVKDDDGKPDTDATLSLVDTTLAKPACDKLQDFFGDMETAVREDSGAYASVAAAGTNAYNFQDKMQIDLVDFLRVLDKTDYKEAICSDEELADVRNAVQSCILYRNNNSAEGVNGMAFAFPYQSMSLYADTSKQLKAMSMKKEKSAFDVIFSIMAAQQKKAMEDPDYMKNAMSESAAGNDEVSGMVMDLLGSQDFTKEDWYVKGFEDYDTTEALVDIPLEETPEGYRIQAPEKIWDIIMDVQTMVYRTTGKDGGNMVYMGRDHIGAEDAEGHPLVGMDDTWVHINGQPVCYEAEPVKETEKGDIYSGKVRARLNDEEDIVLNIEWEPAKEGTQPTKGKIIGYDRVSESIFASIMDSRETLNLKAGDTIQFLFDSYDGEGNLLKTATVGDKIRVTKQSRIKVEDAPMAVDNIRIGGVLTDIYQRTMTTEMLDLDLQ